MSAPGSTTRLLVVAGEAATRDALTAALSAPGWRVAEAGDLDAARELAARSRFDLAVIDLDLAAAPALCDEFASPRRFALPVVALARPDEAALARIAPVCRDVLEKPARADVVRRRVARVLDELRLARELAETRTDLERAQRLARLGSFEVDWNLRRVHCSDAARQVYGLADGVFECPLGDLAELVASPERDAWHAWLGATADGAPERPFEHRLFRRDQTERVVRVHAERQVDARDGAVRLHALVHDITDRRRVEEELEYQALHDDLTGLPNRRQLLEDVEQAIAEAREEQRYVALLFLDLDRFKDVNESLGHAAGDRLLVTVSDRLRDCVREHDPFARVGGHRGGDAVARPGGDEFAVVLGGLHGREEAAQVAQRMLDVLARPFLVDDRELYLTTCIGIATWPGQDSDARRLLKDAETAMYHAKERGRANYALYDPEMDRVADERLAVQSALRRSLERGDLEVWYQPRIELATRRIVGMEALVRWHHPQLGLLMPNRFIPVAEECGLILPVGMFVLKQACAQARRWHDSGFPDLRVAVNVSAEQFRDAALPDDVERVAREAGVAADRLELELTESTLMRDVERALEVLTRLKDKGFHVSIDDFGTGYSSLAYLKRFPIDCLKIDCSFVREVTTDAGDAAITAAILFMAHSLKLDVVAEGVETQEQVDFLRCHRCEQVQGFHFSEPLPAAAATALLMKQVVEPVEPSLPVAPAAPLDV